MATKVELSTVVPLRRSLRRILYSIPPFPGDEESTYQLETGTCIQLGGVIPMEFPIWSIYHIGMLAFRLPILAQYDSPTVLPSLVAATLAFAIALFVVSPSKMGLLRAVLRSILIGIS